MYNKCFFILAVNQEYETDAEKEYVIIGNSALLKCKIPSFVADFVAVESWKDNNDNEYFSGMSSNYGTLTRFDNWKYILINHLNEFFSE